MNRLKYLVVFLCSLMASFSMFADEAECVFDKDAKTYVFFGNGMFTSLKSANATRTKIRAIVRKMAKSGAYSFDYEDFKKFEFALAYNKNESLFTQLEQVIKQRSESEDVIKNRVRAAARKVRDQDLEDHISLYRAQLSLGHRIILIAHSQGSMYANSAYERIKRESPELAEAMTLINIGTPDNRVAKGVYFNLESDWVVNLVEQRFSSTKDPNTVNTTKKGHGVAVYLDGKNDEDPEDKGSGPRIRTAISIAYRTLDYPVAQVQNAVLTVDLRWGKQPDMDLHVFEPDGTHVYYENPRGESGHLTVDDIDGDGPEFYRSTCDEIKPGQYQIAVNYFEGDAPSRAFIKVFAGNKKIGFSRYYTTPTPDAGATNPRKVAIVTVSEGENKRYSFDIKVL